MDVVAPITDAVVSLLAPAIADAVAEKLLLKQPEQVKPKRMSLNDGLAYLNENGFKLSKSTLYKMTMDERIPFSRFGRQIIFDRSELDAWMDEQMNGNDTGTVAKATAESARKKVK